MTEIIACRGGVYVCAQFVHGRSKSYDHRPSHPYYAGTKHVGFPPTRQAVEGGGYTAMLTTGFEPLARATPYLAGYMK